MEQRAWEFSHTSNQKCTDVRTDIFAERIGPADGQVAFEYNPIDARKRSGYILLMLLNELFHSSLRDD
jgi:hypothetical protein